MNDWPKPGAIVCVGPNIVGRVIGPVGPATVSLVFADGEICNARISVLDYHKGPIMSRPRLTPEEKEKRAKEKADAKATTKSTKSKLMEAVKFCAPGFKEGTEAYSMHAHMGANWLTTYNGVLQFGHPIEEPLACFPHFGQLQSALKSTENAPSTITLIDPGKLAIKGGKFRVVVDCVTDPALVVRHAPDQPVGALDSRMREGFEIMKQVASKTGEHVITASVLVRHNSMVATDRHLIVEFWHGLGFPTLTVPADFIEAVLKVPKAISSFGFSDNSLTFWFDDWSFIRTQLYAEEWPDVDRVLPTDFSKAQQIPDGFFESLKKLMPFAKRTWVLFNDNEMSTHEEDNVGCKIEVPGLVEAANGIDGDRLQRLAGYVKHIDVVSDPARVIFAGDMLRGACTTYLFDAAAQPSPAPPAAPGPAVPPPLPPPPPLAYAGDPPAPLNPGAAFMPDPAQTWVPPDPVGVDLEDYPVEDDDVIEDDDEDEPYVPASGFGAP